ncbi:MAG: hypothetical protein WA906_10325 [Pacificimonas sp.]
MHTKTHRAAQIVAVLLISLVATQAAYVALSMAGADINRAIIWTVETLASLGIIAFAAVPLVTTRRYIAAWSAIIGAAVLNVIQLAMGVAMFPPLIEAGEPLAPVFTAVLAGAFFILYAAKFLFGYAALAIGYAEVQAGSGLAKIIGVLATLTGIAAMIAATIAMAFGRDAADPYAGGLGTAAMLLLAVLLTRAVRENS